MHGAYFSLVGGVVCAAIGGEFFVRGVVGVAKWARVPPGIIGATFAAFATSSPELAVSVTAAVSGTPQIALGDALGSNVVNTGLILGLALLFAPLKWGRDALKRDYSFALIAPLLVGLLGRDGLVSRTEGFILGGVFAAWLAMIVNDARNKRNAAPEVLGEKSNWRALAESLFGMIFLVVSGRLIVFGAADLAAFYDIDPFVIGTTLVALGTSAPEIATVIIARMKGHDEVGLGTIFGSNIFNGLLIVSTASLIRPIPVVWKEVSVSLAFGLLTTAAAFALGGRPLTRWRGALLLALYAAYLAVVITAAGRPEVVL